MNDQQNTILRFALIFLMLVVAFIAVLVKILVVQYRPSEREKWAVAEEIQDENTVTIEPVRGNIFDCNGQLLASSIPQYLLYMDPLVDAFRNKPGTFRHGKNKGKPYGPDTLYYNNIDTLCAVLSNVLKWKTKEEYRQYIDAARNPQKPNRRLPLNDGVVTYMQFVKISKLPFVGMANKNANKNGLIWEDWKRRTHPFGNLALRTLGTNGKTEGNGLSGIELVYDSLLRGKQGIGEIIHVNKRKETREIIPAVNGADLITTIDANLQDIVEKELRGPVENYGANWGCCLIMDVHTGEIKAVANLDNVNGKYMEQRNHAFLRVDPGSTFKTVSMLAALDDRKISLGTTVTVTSKPWVYKSSDITHKDSHKMDATITMRQALAVSSNIAFAKMVTTAYNGSARLFVDKLQEMGLRDTLVYDIYGAQQPNISVPKDVVTISKMAYGYTTEMTPVQIAAFYASVANGGKLFRPMLVKEVQQEGRMIKKMAPQVIREQIASPEAIADVRKALHDVVWDNQWGTASCKDGNRHAQSDLVHIAGKTGTAQMWIGRRYSDEHHRFSFVGYFPEEDPQYVCMCVIEDPKYREDLTPHTINAPRGCAVVVRKVAEKTMAYMGCYTIGKNGLELHKRVK
ncbi:MAG: penicillin-binding protein 2 [Paludibacteraceae bacterium]|nr:penicillin-binding protein 2 [Paludibacteraceae bacterium]